MRSAADRSPIAAVVALAVVLSAPAAAEAAERKLTVCKSRVAVTSSPRGFTVGYLYRGDRVTVVRRTASRRYRRIVTASELRGWIVASALCAR